MQTIKWDQKLISKYNINGPRYTSYPTALALNTSFDRAQIQTAIGQSPAELSLYLHIPFCHKLCYYCGCNKVITRHQHKADAYLDALAAEMALYRPHLQQKVINQLSFARRTRSLGHSFTANKHIYERAFANIRSTNKSILRFVGFGAFIEGWT